METKELKRAVREWVLEILTPPPFNTYGGYGTSEVIYKAEDLALRIQGWFPGQDVRPALRELWRDGVIARYEVKGLTFPGQRQLVTLGKAA